MLLEAIPMKILESAKEVLRQSEEDMSAFMAKIIRDTDEMIRQTRIEVSGKAAAAISARLE
jgi:vacuolar-type H+-ATPase subunit H